MFYFSSPDSACIQVWFPGGEIKTGEAIIRSLHDSFRYVRCFRGMHGKGVHMLASMQPFKRSTAEELASVMPKSAAQDLLEWSNSSDLVGYLDKVVATGTGIRTFLSQDPEMRVTDDQPYNEYFFLRRSRLF